MELQQNFLRGDTARNREFSRLAREHGVPLIASNDVHYHTPQRYRLQNALVAARHNLTIDQALPFISPNPHLSLKSPQQMAELFGDCPEALANTARIAESCAFNLSTDLGYALPEPDVPWAITPQRYLKQLCLEATIRRYGAITRSSKRASTRKCGSSNGIIWPVSCCCTGRSCASPSGSCRNAP